MDKDRTRIGKNVSLERWIVEEIESLVTDFPRLNLTFSSALRGVIETGIMNYAYWLGEVSDAMLETDNKLVGSKNGVE